MQAGSAGVRRSARNRYRSTIGELRGGEASQCVGALDCLSASEHRARSAVGAILGAVLYWMFSVRLENSNFFGNESLNTPSSYFAIEAFSSTSCDKLKRREALPT